MKKICILLLSLSCSIYAMENETDKENLTRLLKQQIAEGKLNCARTLKNVGATLPPDYVDEELIEATENDDTELMIFLFSFRPSAEAIKNARQIARTKGYSGLEAEFEVAPFIAD